MKKINLEELKNGYEYSCGIGAKDRVIKDTRVKHADGREDEATYEHEKAGSSASLSVDQMKKALSK